MGNFYPQQSYEKSQKANSKNKNFEISKVFGSRVFSEQSVLEILCEFLNVVKSPKQIKCKNSLITKNTDNSFFPRIKSEDIESFYYSDESHLKLKLFSLYICSSDSSIHPSHSAYYKILRDKLSEKIKVADKSKDLDNNKVVSILENLFMGFQGVGVNRDWCGQSFLPVRKEFLSGETIWQRVASSTETSDKNNITHFFKYFQRNGHNLYARTGEVLFLEIFAALNKETKDITNLLENEFKGIYFSDEEKNPIYVRNELERGLDNLLNNKSPKVLGELAKFINDTDQVKLNSLDNENDNNKMINIGWIPLDNWKYGYLIAVEMIRILSVEMDVIEEIEMLENLFVLHNLRRFTFISSEFLKVEKPLMAVINLDTKNSDFKEISRHSYRYCLTLINKVITQLCSTVDVPSMNSRYGTGAFTRWAKSIDFLVPKTGDYNKFVLTNGMLNCLIMSTIRPNKQISLDTFLEQLEYRFGMVFENKGFNKINKVIGKKQNIYADDTLDWLTRMLEESGYLIKLSDYVSLVKNVSIEQKN